MFKKILSIAIAIMLIFSIVVIASAATPTVRISETSAKPGDTVKIIVSLENNPGIINLKLKIAYNNTVLTLVGIEDAGIFGEAWHAPINQAMYPYTLSWANDTVYENLTVNGTLVTLTFKVNQFATSGKYNITASYGTDYIYNYDLKPVDFSIVNGAITVTRTPFNFFSWRNFISYR